LSRFSSSLPATVQENNVEKRRIGVLEVSIVGVGCNNFGGRIDETRTQQVIDAALDAGVSFFDTADTYADGRSEELLGRFLGNRRSQVIIATKFGLDMPGQGRGAHPEYVRKAFDASLKRLRTDYIDLYQQHRPDPEVPIAETLGALDELVKAGKVREIGCSNFSAQQIREAHAASARRPGSARFVSVQNEYSLLHREPEDEVLGECERQGMAFLPFFPLKSGLLTGKYRKGQPIPQDTRVAKYERYRKLLTEDNLDKVETLIEYAESRGHTILDLAISWLLAHRAVASAIAGASSAQQVRANAAAASWKLTDADLDEIDALLRADAGRAVTR
jgi:aryl-alcohol dehydrogenase-like predicted oxidoreductase